jgi:hypothetical protein
MLRYRASQLERNRLGGHVVSVGVMLARVVEEFVGTVSGLGRSCGCLGPWSRITRVSLNGVQFLTAFVRLPSHHRT